MIVEYLEEVYNFHELYNLIADKQQILPQRKGQKDYSNIEYEINLLANNLIQKISVFKQISDNEIKQFIPQLDNIVYGCYEVINNPYKTKIHRTDLSIQRKQIDNIKKR